MIPEGFALLVGAPKIGKSWLALGIAIAAASGGRALGKIKIEPRPVLLIALEDSPRRLQDRIRQLIGDDPMPANLHCLTRIQHGSVLNTITAWLATILASAKPLVILDTLGRVMPPALSGENQYQRDYRVASALQSVCRPGMAVLVLHHDRKSAADDFVDTISGTHGIGGAADTIVVINRDRNKAEGVLKITGRDVEENEYAIKITDGGWTLQGDDLIKAAEEAEATRAKANLGDLSAQIVDFVNRHHGVQPEEVAQALGIDQEKARTYLNRLAKAGRISKPGRALYTSVLSVSEQHTQYTQHTMYESESDEKPTTTREYGTCETCGQRMLKISKDQTKHPACEEG